MTKTRLFIIGLFLVVAILLCIALLAAQKENTQQQTGLPTPTPVAPPSSIHKATPANQSSTSSLPVPTGDTTVIDNVTTSNFYKSSSVFDSLGDRSLADVDGEYRITYLPGSDQFLITITGPFDQNREAAEQQFLSILHISQEAACQLHVIVQTTIVANPDLAGQDFPLSFCPSPTTSSTANITTPAQVTQQPTYRTMQSLDVGVGNAFIGGAGSGTIVGVAKVITGGLSRSGGELFDQFAGHPRGVFGTMTLPAAIQQLYPSYRVILRAGLPNLGPAWRYWCTDLIIDSYNLALGKRVLGEDLGAVQSQVTFWKTHGGGFVFAHYSANHQAALQALFATSSHFGEPIFWETIEGSYLGEAHVGLISGGNIDSRGNGFITTYEANAGNTTGRYPIVNWQVRNTPFPVVGFGLYNGK